MTREEAIKAIEEASEYFGLLPSEFWYDGKYPIGEAVDMAIEALNREQQIIENGYIGKEMRIRIGGKLFAVRELAQ